VASPADIADIAAASSGGGAGARDSSHTDSGASDACGESITTSRGSRGAQ